MAYSESGYISLVSDAVSNESTEQSSEQIAHQQANKLRIWPVQLPTLRPNTGGLLQQIEARLGSI